MSAFIAHIKNNRTELLKDIEAFRSIVVTKHNAHDSFVELLEGFVITRLIADHRNSQVLHYLKERQAIRGGTDKNNLRLIASDAESESLFFLAIKYGNLELCKILLEKGHDINESFNSTRIKKIAIVLSPYVYGTAYAAQVAIHFGQTHILRWILELPEYNKNNGKSGHIWRSKENFMYDDNNIMTLITREQKSTLKIIFNAGRINKIKWPYKPFLIKVEQELHHVKIFINRLFIPAFPILKSSMILIWEY